MQRQASPSQCGERLTTKDTKSTKKEVNGKELEDKNFRSGALALWLPNSEESRDTLAKFSYTNDRNPSIVALVIFVVNDITLSIQGTHRKP